MYESGLRKSSTFRFRELSQMNNENGEDDVDDVDDIEDQDNYRSN